MLCASLPKLGRVHDLGRHDSLLNLLRSLRGLRRRVEVVWLGRRHLLRLLRVLRGRRGTCLDYLLHVMHPRRCLGDLLDGKLEDFDGDDIVRWLLADRVRHTPALHIVAAYRLPLLLLQALVHHVAVLRLLLLQGAGCCITSLSHACCGSAYIEKAIVVEGLLAVLRLHVRLGLQLRACRRHHVHLMLASC